MAEALDCLAPILIDYILLGVDRRSMRSLGFLGGLLGGLEYASTESAGVRYFSAPNEVQPIGMVMAEKGRICWASCRISGLRLTDILERDAGVPPADLERVFQNCQKARSPLGETLLAEGLVSEDLLRKALLHQTASALVTLVQYALDGQAALSEFKPSPERTYRPMFTFSASEVLVEAIAREVDLQLEAGYPPMAFSALTEIATASICLLETQLQRIPALPILLNPSMELSLDESALLYRQVKSLVHPPTLEAANIHPFAVMVQDQLSRGWVITYAAPHLCLLEFGDRYEAAKLLSGVLQVEALGVPLTASPNAHQG